MNKAKLLEILKRDIKEDDIMDAKFENGCLNVDVVLGIYDDLDYEAIVEIKLAIET